MTAEPLDVARRLTAAFNARNEAALLALLDDDVEILSSLGDILARGPQAAIDWLHANDDMGVTFEPDGPARVEGGRVAEPVVLRLNDGTELRPACVLEVRGGKLTSFRLVRDRSTVGL
jgi:hypothetical protein